MFGRMPQIFSWNRTGWLQQGRVKTCGRRGGGSWSENGLKGHRNRATAYGQCFSAFRAKRFATVIHCWCCGQTEITLINETRHSVTTLQWLSVLHNNSWFNCKHRTCRTRQVYRVPKNVQKYWHHFVPKTYNSWNLWVCTTAVQHRTWRREKRYFPKRRIY